MSNRMRVLENQYNSLFQEKLEHITSQNTIMTIVTSTTGVVLGLGLGAFDHVNEYEIIKIALQYLFCLLLPCCNIFLGLLWLDKVYRQIMVASYIHTLENEMAKICANGTDASFPRLWEEWIADRRKKNPILGSNYFYYCICLGIFIILPIICVDFGRALLKLSFLSFLKHFWITGAAFILFILFIGLYLHAIIKLQDDINSTRLSPLSIEVGMPIVFKCKKIM